MNTENLEQKAQHAEDVAIKAVNTGREATVQAAKAESELLRAKAASKSA